MIGAGELWLPVKELSNVMTEVIRDSQPSEQLIQDVDRILTRHATDFASLFLIKPPSSVDRAELQKCCIEGRYLTGDREKRVIAYSLINEVILLSDMFHINEFLALDLLTIAENEQENYPNWPRGLVAVYMFYQSRVWLISTLCTLIRCSPGRQWVTNLDPQILASFQRVLNFVVSSDDFIDRMITHLEVFSIRKQLEMLESKLALGDAHHRHRVTNLLFQINETLTQTIFCYAGQIGLRWEELILILDYLKTQVNPKEIRVSKADTTLIATVLYNVETTLMQPNVDMSFGKHFRKYLKDHNKDGGFKCLELCDIFKLSFLIAAHKLPIGNSDTLQENRQLDPGPHGDSSGGPNNESGLMFALLGEESGDMEFTRNVFGFLQNEIFARPSNYTWDSNVCKIFHGFFVDFIVHMPLKLKEIKYRSEEAAKIALTCEEQKVSTPPIPPAVPEYESFLECLGEFYKHDPFELGRYYFLENIEYLPLSKLLRMCCLESASLFSSCMRFLTGVSTGNTASMFQLLCKSDHNASLGHFFESVTRYVQNFMMTPQPTSFSMMINPMEVDSICSYLELIQVICANHESARKFLTSQKPSWFRTALLAAKIPKFPRQVRTAMLNTCATMIGEDPLPSPDVVVALWNIFYNTNLIEPGTRDLQMELNEEEIKLGDYSLTIGMLRLLRALIKSRFPIVDYVSLESYAVHPSQDNGAILRYISFVVDAVFLRVPYLHFKDINQRWSMIKLCADILSVLLDYYPKVMIEFLRDSPLIRTLLNNIVECTLTSGEAIINSSGISDERENLVSNQVESCSLSLLVLLWRALQRQQFYLINKSKLLHKQEVNTVLLLGIHEIMMMSTNHGANTATSYIISIIRFVDSMFSSYKHVQTALDILSILLEDRTDMDHMIHHQLVQQVKVANVFKHTIVELLYRGAKSDNVTMELEMQNSIMSALKLLRTSLVHMAPNVGTFLVSFDVKNSKFTGLRTVVDALMDNAAILPTSFMTLLALLTDPRMSQATLELLRRSRFFQSYLRETEILGELSFEALAYFLKCLAVELNMDEGLGQVALDLMGASFERLEDILNIIHMEMPVEVPKLEFFDVGMVMQAIEQCEFVDAELKIKLVRVEKLDGLLKSDIGKLGNNTGLGFRKGVHSEAKHILEFSKKLNQNRCREGCKLLVFDGWRQVVEVMVLNPLVQQHDPVFCSSVLRMLLSKVVVVGDKDKNLSDCFIRMAAETVLTFTAVMTTGAVEKGYHVSGALLNVVIHHLCSWVQSTQNGNVRGILYASLLYCVNLLGDVAEREDSAGLDVLQSSQNSFLMILQNLCRDCCQGGGRTRMQALYLMGEIIKCTTQKGFGGSDGVVGEEILEGLSVRQQHRERNLKKDESGLLKFSASDESTANNGAKQDSCSHLPTRNRSSSIFPWSLPHEVSSSASNQGQKDNGNSSCFRGVDRAIINCVYTNGFLSALVDALCAVDDIDLITLFTSASGGTQEEDITRNIRAMRAFFVFEAKLTMLSRFAGVGPKAVMHLLDLKLVENLTGMKVFELQTYHHQQQQVSQIEIMSQAQGPPLGGSSYPLTSPLSRRNDGDNNGQNQNWLQGIGLPDAASTPMQAQQDYRQQTSAQQVSTVARRTPTFTATTTKGFQMDETVDTSHTISETLYTQVLKLFHVILDSAPKNLVAITQILRFLHTHDSTLSKLLSSVKIGNRDRTRLAAQMLTSLLYKLAKNQQRINSMTPMFSPKANVMLKPGLYNILRMEAEENIAHADEIVTLLVKQVLLFLYYCSKKMDGEDTGNEQQGVVKINPVLANRFDLDNVLKDQNANVGLGVIMRCVINAAQNIASSQVSEKRKFAFANETTNRKVSATTPQTQQVPSSSSATTGFGSLPLSLSSQHLTSSRRTFLTEKMVKDSQDIIELGLTLMYSHLQLFIQEYQEMKQLKRGDKLTSYLAMVGQQVENNLTRVTVEACKKIQHEDYIETLLHKIRKVAVPASEGEGH